MSWLSHFMRNCASEPIVLTGVEKIESDNPADYDYAVSLAKENSVRTLSLTFYLETSEKQADLLNRIKENPHSRVQVTCIGPTAPDLAHI